MKKLLYLALFISLIFFSSYGFYLHGSGATGGGCSGTPSDSFETYSNAISNGAIYWANKITTGSAYNCCRVDVNVYRHADDTSDYVVELRADNSDEPAGSILGTSDTVLNANIPTGALDWVQFDFSSSVSLSSSTDYWIVMKRIGSTTAYAMNIGVGNNSPEHIVNSGDGTPASWSDLSTSRQGLFRTYGEN